MTYTMGFGSAMAMPDTYPVQKFIRGSDWRRRSESTRPTCEWLQKLGSLPSWPNRSV